MRLSYSALDLRHYLEESNKTLHSERIYIVVVHLGIGFLARRKMSPWDLFEICNFSLKSNSAFPRKISYTIGRNQMKPCIEEEYIS